MDQYRVFGNPIAQSRSPYIHQAFAKQTEQALNYQSQLIEVGQFSRDVHAFIAQGGKGANVTMPFKDDAFSMCHELTERAKVANAVNTLSFKNGKIYGDTTDGIGLVNDLKNHHVELKNKTILLLGAGGAARGVVLPILNEQPKQLIIANRTVAKAQVIADQYPNYPIDIREFSATIDFSFDIIINATSTGLSGGEVPIPDSVITPNTICYDMVYGATLPSFLQKAQALGAKQVIDGLGMLVEQAAESFFIWRKVKPNTGSVMASLRDELMNKKGQ